MSETKYGWVCPKCGVVLAPWVTMCNCVKTYYTQYYRQGYETIPWWLNGPTCSTVPKA